MTAMTRVLLLKSNPNKNNTKSTPQTMSTNARIASR